MEEQGIFALATTETRQNVPDAKILKDEAGRPKYICFLSGKEKNTRYGVGMS